MGQNPRGPDAKFRDKGTIAREKNVGEEGERRNEGEDEKDREGKRKKYTERIKVLLRRGTSVVGVGANAISRTHV